jgi:hypothetical protein
MGIDGLPTRSEIEISEAIQDCVRECMGDKQPHTCADAYAIKLVSVHRWTESDAREVRTGALGVLARIIGIDPE